MIYTATWVILCYQAHPPIIRNRRSHAAAANLGFLSRDSREKKNAVDVSNLSESYNLLMARVWKVSWVRGVGKLLAGKIVLSEM